MKVTDKIIYTAVFLTPESQQKLLTMFPPRYKKVFAHHSTIEFRPRDTDISLGESYQLKITGYVFDEKAQVILVENKFLTGVNPKNAHITISTRDDTPPAYADELVGKALRENKVIPVREEYLDGRTGYFNGVRDIF